MVANDKHEFGDAAVNSRKKTPLLVMSSAPVPGHMEPTLTISRELIQRGFDVIYLGVPEFKDSIEGIGAEYHETTPFWVGNTKLERQKIPLGPESWYWDLKHMFIPTIPGRSERLRQVLESVRQREPQRQVVIVAETGSHCAFPFMWGAPLPKGYAKFPKVINIHVMPLTVDSIDVAPFGLALPPDSTVAGRARNKALQEEIQSGPLTAISKVHDAMMDSLGCNYTYSGPFQDAWLLSFNTCFQMCIPSVEYPRSDLHPSVRYAGFVPQSSLGPHMTYPSWWSEFVTQSELPPSSPDRKSVVFVSQGTIATDYDELVIPTISSLALRKDIYVIATLGIRGATLPAHTPISPNIKVIDHFPYDAVLKYADVFVTNGGYGSLRHAVLNGVPMVVAGLSEDKAEVAARAEWAGLAVNLKTHRPTSEQIVAGVDTILRNTAYKLEAERLQKEANNFDSISIIEREVWRYADEEM